VNFEPRNRPFSHETGIVETDQPCCTAFFANLPSIATILRQCSERFLAGLRANKQTPKGASIRIDIKLEMCTRIGLSKLINVGRETVLLLSL